METAKMAQSKKQKRLTATSVIRCRVDPATKRKVAAMGTKTLGGESAVIRSAVAKLIGGKAGK